MRKQPWKCFQWYCLPEGHINWNKGQIPTIFVSLKFSIDVSSGTFLYQMIAQETNLRKQLSVVTNCPMLRVTSYPVMSKEVNVICHQCFSAADSFWLGVYSWNHKGDPKWSFLPYGCGNTVLGAMQRPCTIPHTKRQFNHLCQLDHNDVNNDKEQSAKVSIPHSVDGAGRCYWDSEHSKLI